jgi:short-subunit dehydrogenase
MNSVIITGSSDGIGKDLAYSFSKRGFRIGLMARRIELLETVAEECLKLGAKQVLYKIVDVSNEQEFIQALTDIDDKLSTDIFIANAGIGLNGNELIIAPWQFKHVYRLLQFIPDLLYYFVMKRVAKGKAQNAALKRQKLGKL